MAAVRSRATFVGLWATQTAALVAMETLVRHGSNLLWAGVIWGSVTAAGLAAAHGSAHGQKLRPRLVRSALLVAGVLAMFAVLSVSPWIWVAVYAMAVTQAVRNASLCTEQDFQLACAVPMVLAIFSVGHVAAHWGVTRYLVIHLAALQFTLIAHHAEQRFDAHTAHLHTRWLAPLSFLSMLGVLCVAALLHLWLTQPPGLHARLVPTQGVPTPGADGAPAGPGSSPDPSWLDAVRTLLGDTVADAIRSVVSGLDALVGAGSVLAGDVTVPSPGFILPLLLCMALLHWLRVIPLARSTLELLWLDLRIHRIPSRTAVLATWNCLERILARLDAPRPASSTHHEYARDLRSRAWLDGIPLADAACACARARYGDGPVAPADIELGLWVAHAVRQRWWRARIAALPRPDPGRFMAWAADARR